MAAIESEHCHARIAVRKIYIEVNALFEPRLTVLFLSVVQNYSSLLQLANFANSSALSGLQLHANHNDEPHEQDEADDALVCHRSTLANEYPVGSKYDAERLRHEGLTPHLNRNKSFRSYISRNIGKFVPLAASSTCLLPESFLPEMLPTIWCYIRRNQHSDNAIFRSTSRDSAWSGYGEEYN